MKKFLRYLLGKRSELEELELKDLVMAKTILDIHRKRSSKAVVRLSLFALFPIHVIDRAEAIEALQERIAALEPHRAAFLASGQLTCEDLARVLPSVSWIKVVEDTPGTYLAFEGNGRIAALQAVFTPEDELAVEVELYHFKNPAKIRRRLQRVRRLNGLPGLAG